MLQEVLPVTPGVHIYFAKRLLQGKRTHVDFMKCAAEGLLKHHEYIIQTPKENGQRPVPLLESHQAIPEDHEIQTDAYYTP